MKLTAIRRAGVAAVVVAGVSGVLVSCSDDKVALPPDSVGCVFNNKSGELVGDPRLPGQEISQKDDQSVVFLPLSDRFWSINTDPAKRDVAASESAVGFDSGQRETLGQFEIKFIIHPANACQFYAEHLRRYEPLEFNVEGDASTGWMRVLSRNVDSAMVDAWQETIPNYDGLIAALGLPMNANPDGTLPEGVEPEPVLHFALRADTAFAQRITDNIGSKLNGNYLCGPTTDVTDPNDCDPVTISTVEPIRLSSAYDETIARWRNVAVQRANTQLVAEEESAAADQFDQEQAARDAEADRANTQREAANAATLDELEDNAGVVDAEQAAAAGQAIAPCVAESDRRGEQISTQECIDLLAVLSDQYGRDQFAVLGAGSGESAAPTTGTG